MISRHLIPIHIPCIFVENPTVQNAHGNPGASGADYKLSLIVEAVCISCYCQVPARDDDVSAGAAVIPQRAQAVAKPIIACISAIRAVGADRAVLDDNISSFRRDGGDAVVGASAVCVYNGVFSCDGDVAEFTEEAAGILGGNSAKGVRSAGGGDCAAVDIDIAVGVDAVRCSRRGKLPRSSPRNPPALQIC